MDTADGQAAAARRSRRAGTARRYSTAAKVTAGIVSVFVAAHMILTLVYNVPSQEFKSTASAAVAKSYMEPLFVQDYKIFAPDPAGADHQLWVRAWSEDRDGEPWTSEWINVSAVELAEPYRKVLRKQLTIVGAERGMSGYQGLSDEQRDIASRNYHRSTLDALRTDLLTADPAATGRVDAFIRSSRYIDAYATQVAFALWGDESEIAAVQTRVVYDPVIRWSDRNDPEARRPAATITDTGWHPLLEYPGQDREAFASTFLEWANE